VFVDKLLIFGLLRLFEGLLQFVTEKFKVRRVLYLRLEVHQKVLQSIVVPINLQKIGIFITERPRLLLTGLVRIGGFQLITSLLPDQKNLLSFQIFIHNLLDKIVA
jgi:hypothetical protein